MEQFKGHVTEMWQPTFENVAREFITDSLYKILFSEDLPNFRFDFREKEAIDYIKEVLEKHVGKYDPKKAQKILKAIGTKCDKNENMPVMIINDYKKFFELLRKIYKRHIELYFLRSNLSFFPRWEKENLFEQIWLRATPEDFNNPEEFLRKQAEMIYNTTFGKYDEETCLGEVSFFDNNILCVKNGIARVWDENSREIELIIYDKEYYGNTELFFKPHYTLPVIRYGIYKRNGKKVCSIGSIQNKENYRDNDIGETVNRKRYKANDGVPKEDTSQVEPKNILALSIFINLLHREGITEIEVPGLYVLDYEYHQKRNNQILKEFEADWSEEKIKKDPEGYEKSYYHFQRIYKKEELISEIKTERLLLTFRRLLYHYPNGIIKSYPGDADSFMHLSVPVVKSKSQVNGGVFQELYDLLDEKGVERYF